jgi:3D (Asp-Asp-Asp) domain-containing protein
MRYKRLILALIAFITLCGSLLMIINTDKPQTPERVVYSDYRAQDMVVPIPRDFKRPTPTPIPSNRVVIYYCNCFKPYYLDKIPLLSVELELESLGYYFITAYCPAECGGSWTTASGSICHRANYYNRYTEPTTCAIDKQLNSFGDTFYISEFDRVFIAEDTGSAVKNKHLDLFYIEYEDVLSFQTGYYEVYSVEYNYSFVPAVDYDVRILIQESFIDNTRP